MARIPLRQIMAVLLTAALTLSLSMVLTVTSTKEAAASCSANRFNGTWRSSDARLKRIDVWQGEDCHLYANWSNADEVLQLRMQDWYHISVWDSTDYHSGKKVSFTVAMYKSS
ncbi:hypothetical protein ABZ490_40725 [Streptomyces sp. NPDC005811]|uniref:hypothetical protein n=1 Tax=Streptomyces sp. NPDC005811 TaxID=3154565 RepID=UPI0033C662CA